MDSYQFGKMRHGYEALSDSETVEQAGRQFRAPTDDVRQFRAPTDQGYTDDDNHPNDFNDHRNNVSKMVRSGRQRKKASVRGKGGEFQAKRKKRRLYFCCVSSEIDVQSLHDKLSEGGELLDGWEYHLYNDVLRLYKPGVQEEHTEEQENEIKARAATYYPQNGGSDTEFEGKEEAELPFIVSGAEVMTGGSNNDDVLNGPSFSLSANGTKEVFVFDFGAAVFWGFSRGEETNILKIIRMFVTKGIVNPEEYQVAEDDMAFVITSDRTISIANDVISLPETSIPKERLSVSFAIAQSSVLEIFEARIESKIEEYKYIPPALAAHGKVSKLNARALGMMIGEVFVIRHDVNLHSEILDIPDFFWNEHEDFTALYKMVLEYLEMNGRTEVLNMRLDMLRELLDVLQKQLENAHAVKLEWIVIYLIVAEVVLQILAIMVNYSKSRYRI